MLQISFCRSWVSRGLSAPVTAYSNTCVSTFSIPVDTGGEDVALDLDLALERADEARRVSAEGNQLRHRLPPFRDHDSVLVDLVDQRQAAFLEFCGGHLFHDYIIRLVISN